MPPDNKRQEGDNMGYSHGTKWTDELIRKKVLEAKEALSLDRMPSRKECIQYFHDESLVNAISRRTGWYKLAEELGLKVKDSETYFGKSQEANAADILVSMGFLVRKMPQNFPYDLLVDNCVKVDVKASHIYHGQNGNFYTFNLEKQFATCDVYVLFALDDHGGQRIFVVPSKFVVSQNQISMGVLKSKYHKFENKWDFISALSDFWSDVG